MFDDTLLKIFLRFWAKKMFFASPNHPKNRVSVRREYTDFGTFYDLSWRIEDTRETEHPLQPYFLQERFNLQNLRQEVERIEREIITPQVNAMLEQMQ